MIDQPTEFPRLVPSEHSSGQSRRLGKITKAGSTHARRLLVEAAQNYRLAPSVGGKLAARQRDQDPVIIDMAWRIQRRLHARWHLLRVARGKPNGVVTIALARELIGRLLGDRHGHLTQPARLARRGGAASGNSRTHDTSALSPVTPAPTGSISDSGRCDEPRS